MGSIDQAKSELRVELLRQRKAFTLQAEEKRQADAAIVSFIAAYVRGLSHPHPRVAAYSPLPTEPGDLTLLDALASQASSIILPISMQDGTLRWSAYRGRASLAAGPLGVWQPTGPQLNSHALKSCDVVFVPAMAIDSAGNRLGKGAGYYDRALADIKGTVPLIGVVYHTELLPHLPTAENDTPVDAVITDRGFRPLDS